MANNLRVKKLGMSQTQSKSWIMLGIFQLITLFKITCIRFVALKETKTYNAVLTVAEESDNQQNLQRFAQ